MLSVKECVHPSSAAKINFITIINHNYYGHWDDLNKQGMPTDELNMLLLWSSILIVHRLHNSYYDVTFLHTVINSTCMQNRPDPSLAQYCAMTMG